MAFFAVCANNILVETVSLNTRITFGYLVSVVTLNFVLISEIWWEFFGVTSSYTINLIAVAVVSVGCTGKFYEIIILHYIYVGCHFHSCS